MVRSVEDRRPYGTRKESGGEGGWKAGDTTSSLRMGWRKSSLHECPRIRTPRGPNPCLVRRFTVHSLSRSVSGSPRRLESVEETTRGGEPPSCPTPNVPTGKPLVSLPSDELEGRRSKGLTPASHQTRRPDPTNRRPLPRPSLPRPTQIPSHSDFSPAVVI